MTQSPRVLSILAAVLALFSVAGKGCGSSDAGSAQSLSGDDSDSEMGDDTTSSGAGGSGGEDPRSVDIIPDGGPSNLRLPAFFGAYCGNGLCDVNAPASECLDTQPAGGHDTFSCQLGSHEGEIVSVCAPDGTKNTEELCANASDCAGGLGCVTTSDEGGSVCREYCCGDVEDCSDATYCALAWMAEDTSLEIPVCTPVTPCELLNSATCSEGQACAIVRDDGTTSCIDEGDGLLDEDCPCAAGYLCVKNTNTCKKLCHVGADSEECPGGYCQGGSKAYPDGFGICVGGDKKSAEY